MKKDEYCFLYMKKWLYAIGDGSWWDTQQGKLLNYEFY